MCSASAPSAAAGEDLYLSLGQLGISRRMPERVEDVSRQRAWQAEGCHHVAARDQQPATEAACPVQRDDGCGNAPGSPEQLGEIQDPARLRTTKGI